MRDKIRSHHLYHLLHLKSYVNRGARQLIGRSQRFSLCEEHHDVSRETCDKLDHYVALLEKWQKSINFISPKTLPEIWERHILDSAQLLPICQKTSEDR